MPTTYYLSSRQHKELGRGRPLHILVPSPPNMAGDALSWAKSAIDPNVRDRVREAKRVIVRVNPTRGSDGLTGVIGEIDPNVDGYWSIGVEVIAISLSPPVVRAALARSQWASHCVHDGIRIPLGSEEPR